MARTCRRCGWPKHAHACLLAHARNPAVRGWSRHEWTRYRASGRLPWRDSTSRRDRRQTLGGRICARASPSVLGTLTFGKSEQ